MRDRFLALLEKADLALGSVAGIVDEGDLSPLAASVDAVRTRLSYPEDILVVALAGGTGSGKSSLFNALAGAELVDVGGMRPTTSHPAAAVPARAPGVMDGYLDRLGIEERHRHQMPGICLIDLPDTDSVEVDHRHRVDGLFGKVDVVVWVTDPEKYRDSRLHDDYLRPMARYSGQFLFVMNQIDRLAPVEAEEVCHDFEEALVADGLGAVAVIPVAAAPPSGPPIGLDRLRSVLEGLDRESLHGKLLVDLETTSAALAGAAGGSLDFDARAAPVVTEAARSLIAGDRSDATAVLTGFVDSIEKEVGGPLADRIAVVAAGIPAHLDRIAGELAPAAPVGARRLFQRRAEPEPVDPATAEPLIREAVIRPVRALLAKRALAMASVAELGVEIETLRTAR